MKDFNVELKFPYLSGEYDIKSSPTIEYNCVAWAAGENNRIWWPNRFYYWPAELPRKEKIGVFIRAFQLLGYIECPDSNLEDGFEKIAIFAKEGIPKHVARQLVDGNWTSKLGPWYDIEHLKIDGIRGSEYGIPIIIMKRPRK